MSSTMRFQFRKGKEVRFLSHLDIVRTMERAVRRAKIPIALSEGFHPKPKMNFASALAVGITSCAEYGDFILGEELSPTEFVQMLNQVLPPGLSVMKAGKLPGKTPALMSVVNAAEYAIRVSQLSLGEIDDAIRTVDAAQHIHVERTLKKGIRQIDVRPLIYDIWHANDEVKVRCSTGSSGNLRPEEILDLLGIDRGSAVVERTGLFIRDDQSYTQPFMGIEVYHAE